MKTSWEQGEMTGIAAVVIKMLSPMLLNRKHEAEDIVFDKKGLSEYLKVSISTIDKMVSNKEIPYFKIQPGQSGGVRFFKKDIDKWISRQTVPAT
jgi:excisionase family DNA binding protein